MCVCACVLQPQRLEGTACAVISPTKSRNDTERSRHGVPASRALMQQVMQNDGVLADVMRSCCSSTFNTRASCIRLHICFLAAA